MGTRLDDAFQPRQIRGYLHNNQTESMNHVHRNEMS
jgi:hypothetical protein